MTDNEIEKIPEVKSEIAKDKSDDTVAMMNSEMFVKKEEYRKDIDDLKTLLKEKNNPIIPETIIPDKKDDDSDFVF